MDELFYRIAWTQIPGFGHGILRQLIRTFGSGKEAWLASFSDLKGVEGLGERLVYLLKNHRKLAFEQSEQQVQLILKHNIQWLLWGESGFPDRLKQCIDSPAFLLYKGQLDWHSKRWVAVVGTRKATEQGRISTREIVKVLAEYNAVVVSGLAYGIDICAHREALDCGIPTLAILGSGLNRIYPSEHSFEAKRILENGAVATEFMPNEGPDREHFPMRNRIIAGISDAVVVVEAGNQGGAWITARLANDYNRDVFAVPGPWNKPYSLGCNQLISSHLAAILTQARDIPKLLSWNNTAPEPTVRQLQLFPAETQNVADILIRENKPVFFDDLLQKSGYSASELQVLLFKMEMEGCIKNLPGRFIQLC